MTNTERLILRAPTTIREQLDLIAEKRKVSRSVVIRWALDHYISSFFSHDCLPKETKDREKNTPDQPHLSSTAIYPPESRERV